MSNRKKEVFGILEEVFGGVYIQGPVLKNINMECDFYINNHINRELFIQKLTNLKICQMRWNQIVNFYVSNLAIKCCNDLSNNVIKNHFVREVISQYNQEIIEYTNGKLSFTFLKHQFFINHDDIRRRVFINDIVKKMINYEDFKFLPGNIQSYFGFYFWRYLNKQIDSVEMLRLMEEKYSLIKDIIASKKAIIKGI